MLSGVDSTFEIMTELISNTDKSAFFISECSHMVQLTEIKKYIKNLIILCNVSGNANSDTVRVSTGVPQSSVLGPLLYLYVHSLSGSDITARYFLNANDNLAA